MRKKLPEDSDFFLSPTPSRDMILLLAKARARRELAEEAKEAALRSVNQPQPSSTGYVRPPDVFQLAAERMRAIDEAVAAIDAEHAARMCEIDRHFALKRRHVRTMQKAREILGNTAFFAARAEARRRKAKR